jgi:hypothetical protein
MAKRIHHMGMIIGKADHDEFHGSAPDLEPKQHEALMKRMGITKEQDEAWHRTHLTLGEQRARGLTHIDPPAIGAGFIEWCVKQGWLVRRGKECFASKDGVRELGARFDIIVERTQRR